MTKLLRSRHLLLLLISFTATSCGFSTGLYDDILKAQELITENKFKPAVRIYEGILKKKPSKTIRIKINYQLGEIYSIYLSDYKKSIEHFNIIVNNSNEPKWQVKSLEKLGAIYFEKTKDFSSASKSYLQLKNFYPVLNKYNFYVYRYGLSLFHGKKYTKSAKVFNKLITKKNSIYSIQAYYYTGLANFYKKEYKLALENWFEYLKREKRKDRIVQTKFLIANAYETTEKLKEAYNIYYSILGEYPNTEVIKTRLESLYQRRVARKR
jgi:tetratricopeptide (TPR) repeat protein